MGAVALAAFALSFQSLTQLGTFAGYGPLSFLYPLTVDLGTVAGCVTWLTTRSREAAAMMWGLLSISVIQNGAVHWLMATGQRPAWWLVTLVATVPPATLGLVVHLGVGLGETLGATKGFQLEDLKPKPAAGEDLTASGPDSGEDVVPPHPDPVAELIEAGAGRRQVAAELGITEYKARQLIASTRISRNGVGDVQT